ncbi:hypothetical protein L0128_18640 [candidate division KSB1 bacterium]|nr:hypothetical protein [candidate division KSB1 bacterium]
MFGKYLLLLVICFSFGCKSSQQLNQNQKSAMITLAAIYKKPKNFINQEITLDGQYLGWSGRDCRFPKNASPAITRSDWIFRDTTGCIYVNGGRLPTLDPFNTAHLGAEISLRAIPRLTHKKKVYLEYISGSIRNDLKYQ